MSVKRKVLKAWAWIQEPLTEGRLFLLVGSLVIFCLVAQFGYRYRPLRGRVCIFKDKEYICRMLFFCTFVTMVTCLVFLGLDPYLPSIQVVQYLRLICLIDLVTAVLWLFVWAFGSFLLLEQWIRTDTGSVNVHSTRSIIVISFGGAACWVVMVMLLTKRLKEVNMAEAGLSCQVHSTGQVPCSSNQLRNKSSRTGPVDAVTQSV